MNVPQVLLLIFLLGAILIRLALDFFKGTNRYVDEPNQAALIFGHMLGCLFVVFLFYGPIFLFLIWGGFFTSK